MEARTFVDNAEAGRYELHVDDRVVSIATYRRDGDVVTIPHVETDPARRGNGHADELMDAVLDHIRAEGLRLRPLCGFAAAHVRSRPDQQDLLAG